MPRRFDDYEVSNTFQDYKIELTEAERQYYSTMEMCAQHIDVEHSMVGAGIGGGFENTNELHVMSYDQAMELVVMFSCSFSMATFHLSLSDDSIA
jgi:hypothetical protein